LHHFWPKGGKPTIAAHKKYCGDLTKSFRDGGNNALVQQRLEMVLNAYRGGKFKSDRHEVFMALAKAVVRELPAD
jgi:hypothetical protein